MGKIFDIYLAKKDQPESGAYAALSLPATLCQMQDAFDKLRLAEGEALYWEITEYHQFEELSAVLNDTCGLYELNALAQKLSELDVPQCTAFSGLLAMEQSTKRPIPITRLIDLACSTDCCHVAGDALNDSQLGRIRAESGCVPGIDKLPKDVFEMLDFEQIGRNIRISENGVFVKRSMDYPGGYVARHSPVMEAARTLDLTPKAPDYTVLLEVSHDGSVVQLKLPASEESLAAIPQMMNEPDWQDLSLECLDCCIPTLMDAVAGTDDIAFLNCLAEKLAALEPQELTACKALLEARNCRDLASVGLLAGQLDNYNFCPEYGSPAEVAKGQLSLILGEREAGMILPHLDLEGYGKDLLQYLGGAMTPYGLLEKKDGAPLISERDHQKTNGMEMS